MSSFLYWLGKVDGISDAQDGKPYQMPCTGLSSYDYGYVDGYGSEKSR